MRRLLVVLLAILHSGRVLARVTAEEWRRAEHIASRCRKYYDARERAEKDER